MTGSESVRLAQAASMEVRPSVIATMRAAAARDDRLGAEAVAGAARLALTAWAMAVDGDDTELAAMAQPDALHWLLHPVRESWQVAPGPAVTQIEIWDLDADAEPARLRLSFKFTGRRRFSDPDQTDRPAEGEMPFVGMLTLTLSDRGPQPWRLSSGHVQTLDKFLGYVFRCRSEIPQEYQQRAASAADPVPAAGPGRPFRITAGFAEHDERFGSSATIYLRREPMPTRAEAEELIWPVIRQVTRNELGEGDWRPSMNWLDVVELRDEPSVS